jgi:hypothetical protein
MLVIKGDLKWVTGRTILRWSRFSMILTYTKTFADTTVLSLMKKISTKMQVVLGELLRTETIIRKRFVKNLTNGETR